MKHLTTHYGDNNGQLAKVYIMDEQTYVVYLYHGMQEVTHKYVDTFVEAESIAESFASA